MAAQKGKDVLIKIMDAGAGTFRTVAGLRTRTISLNAQTVDITDSESVGQWRELLAGGGVRRASISGSGIFKDAPSDALVREAFFAGQTPSLQIVIPDFGALEADFAITALEYAGNHDGEVTFELALESASAVSFGAL